MLLGVYSPLSAFHVSATNLHNHSHKFYYPCEPVLWVMISKLCITSNSLQFKVLHSPFRAFGSVSCTPSLLKGFQNIFTNIKAKSLFRHMASCSFLGLLDTCRFCCWVLWTIFRRNTLSRSVQGQWTAIQLLGIYRFCVLTLSNFNGFIVNDSNCWAQGHLHSTVDAWKPVWQNSSSYFWWWQNSSDRLLYY